MNNFKICLISSLASFSKSYQLRSIFLSKRVQKACSLFGIQPSHLKHRPSILITYLWWFAWWLIFIYLMFPYFFHIWDKLLRETWKAAISSTSVMVEIQIISSSGRFLSEPLCILLPSYFMHLSNTSWVLQISWGLKYLHFVTAIFQIWFKLRFKKKLTLLGLGDGEVGMHFFFIPLGFKLNADTFWLFLNISIDDFRTIKLIG